MLSPNGGASFSSTWGTTKINAPFASAAAGSVPVPISRFSLSGVTALQDNGSTDVLLPTLALDNTTLVIAWTFYV